jgi:hypothetical protein
VVTRRSALLAGVVLLAGCGKEDAENAPADPPPSSEALLPALAAMRAAAAASAGAMASRTRERADRIAGLISAAGGRPHDAPAPAAGGSDPAAAQRAALEALIAALPALADARAAASALIAGTAADLARLTGEPEAFPGSAA